MSASTSAPVVATPAVEADGIMASACARAVETDRIYFEMGARIESLPGAKLAWMPGLTSSPAAAVVQRAVSEVVAAAGMAWVIETERTLARLGAPVARIYLDRRDTPADGLLRRAGYVARDELVFAGELSDPAGPMNLRPLVSDTDWLLKLRFHEEAAERPDGHQTSATDWVRLEREKCAAGMKAFLAEVDGEAVGAIGLIRGEGLLRIKNVVVHPAFRRRSFGLMMLHCLAAVGRSAGLRKQCIFAVEGGVGERLYRAAGLGVIGAQVEWSKKLPGDGTRC